MKTLTKIFLVLVLAVSVSSAQDIMTQMYGNLDILVTISEALAADDFAAAQKSTVELHGRINPSKTGSPSYKAIGPLVDNLKAAKDIEAFRKAYLELSTTLIPHVKMYGGLAKAKLFTCPMANNNKGGQWLQKGDKARNPYFGKKMLNCGSVVK